MTSTTGGETKNAHKIGNKISVEWSTSYRLGGAYREAVKQVEVIVKICSVWIGFCDYDDEPQGSVTAVSWLSECR